LAIGATGIILVHNHPSGTLKPSSADKQLTKKLKLASESLDIKVLDHLIVTEKAYFSFADESLL
jgi:DNA repair protein RadC